MSVIQRCAAALGLALMAIVGGQPLAAATPIPSAPDIAAKAYILVDYHTGRALAEGNADERMEPASLTKIMSAYVAFSELRAGHVKLDDQVHISETAWRTGGSRMFVEVGTKVSFEDLLKGMIIVSGNDASVAVAEHVAGSVQAFASLMNIQAKRLGMTGSHFVNSDGLPDADHYTTARDLAILTRALIHDFPDFYKWHSQMEFTYNKITQGNRNMLLTRDESVDGVKTGHTSTAGYCLVASAKRDDMRLISAMLGTDSVKARARETQKLLNYGFRFYETHRIFGPGETVQTARVWMGTSSELPIGLSDGLYVTIARGRFQNIEQAIDVEPEIHAPVSKGQAVGSIKVTSGGEVVESGKLVALHSVEQGSWWRRLLDYLVLLFVRLFH